MTLSTGPWWWAPVFAFGWITTVPAHSFSAPARACVIAAARFIPGVCGVLMSSSFECTTRTPSNFHLGPVMCAFNPKSGCPRLKQDQGGNTMTNRFLLKSMFFFTAGALASLAAAQEGGRITKVMLYPGSATVERAAQVTAG